MNPESDGEREESQGREVLPVMKSPSRTYSVARLARKLGCPNYDLICVDDEIVLTCLLVLRAALIPYGPKSCRVTVS